jgi:L-cysteine:1D-myo-inositol 2-amino-2-deoxy-alpha-D-glucopyranoside ligase
MQSWPGPQRPELPGTGLPVRLHDTATRQVRATAPGSTARLYVCGITPYDATHMGHAATYVAFDLLVRAWSDAGHEVHYVQNVTDVDDPLLVRAQQSGEDWEALAEREIDLFRADMAALRVIPPRAFVGAVESIPLIADYVQQLQQRGAAYQVEDDLYFSVRSDPRFGSVAGLSEPQMLDVFAERGGDPERAGKKDPLDCLLWQAERPDEPAWDTGLGRGRPGWHIECAAIAVEHLGMAIDVQGGGSDLAFPHHEMGASEAHVATGEWPYARTYAHAGMVALDGEKMSKSKGNLVFVSRLREEGHDPSALRLALLAHHYRDDWEWTDAGLVEATARLARWRAAVAAPAGPPAEPVLADVRRHLADDLDAPGALAVIDRWVEQVRLTGGRADVAGADDPGAPDLVRRTADALLGVAL